MQDMNNNPLVKITSEAAKDAALAQRKFETEAKAKRVNLLAEEITERVSALIFRAEHVRQDVRRAEEHGIGFTRGAFGSDTATLDELLSAFAGEVEELHNMRAALQVGDDLMAKYEVILAEAQEQAAAEGQSLDPGAIPVGAGQYL